MGLIRSLLVKLGMETATFDAGCKRAKNSFYGLTRSMAESQRSMAMMGKAVVGAYITKTITGFVGKTIEAMHSQEHMAERLGVTTNELRRLGYAADQVGVPVEELTKGMSFMEKTLGGGSDSTKETIKELGLDFAKLKSQSPKQTLEEIVSAINKMGNQYDKAAKARELFGKGMAAITQMADLPRFLNDITSKSLDRSIFDQAMIADGVIELNKFKATIGLLKEDISIGLIPSLTGAADALRDFIAAGRLPGEGENSLFTSKGGKWVLKVADMGHGMKIAAQIALRMAQGGEGFESLPSDIADIFFKAGKSPSEQAADFNKSPAAQPAAKMHPNIVAAQREAEKNRIALEAIQETWAKDYEEKVKIWDKEYIESGKEYEKIQKRINELQHFGDTDRMKLEEQYQDLLKNREAIGEEAFKRGEARIARELWDSEHTTMTNPSAVEINQSRMSVRGFNLENKQINVRQDKSIEIQGNQLTYLKSIDSKVGLGIN